jgi:hypothetical protein
MIKELLSKMKEASGRLGMGISYDDKIEKSKKIKGEFFLTLKHNDGREEKFHYPNVIVDTSSLLIARLLADGQTSIDPSGPNHGIRVLAVGTGDPLWNPNNPPNATAAQNKLEAELARKRFANVSFVRTDGTGLPATNVTNILDFQTVFNESEAVGPIMELGLFGGGTGSENIDTGKDSGTMINYRTIAVINKPNTATLSIVFRITT